LTVTSLAPVADAERVTQAGQSAAILVLLKASTGILEERSVCASAGVNGFS
jgi:hypothetical protein